MGNSCKDDGVGLVVKLPDDSQSDEITRVGLGYQIQFQNRRLHCLEAELKSFKTVWETAPPLIVRQNGLTPYVGKWSLTLLRQSNMILIEDDKIDLRVLRVTNLGFQGSMMGNKPTGISKIVHGIVFEDNDVYWISAESSDAKSRFTARGKLVNFNQI